MDLKELLIQLQNDKMEYFDEFYNLTKNKVFYMAYSILQDYHLSDYDALIVLGIIGNYANGNTNDGFLYLCWTSPYYTNKSNTILQFTESNTKYNLYLSVDDMNKNTAQLLDKMFG